MRLLLLVLAALLVLGPVAGCGGGDGADGSTDVDELLRDTFAAGKSITSGKVDATLRVATEGDDTATLDAKLEGPFQSTGEGKLPELDLEASLAGPGQTLSGGVTATDDRGFVSIGEDTYEVSGAIWEQFKAGYEESAKQGKGAQDPSLATLGLDPRRWLTDARNAGESKVGDTDTVKITGTVDVPRLLEDVNRALERIRSLGVQGTGRLPEQLTEAERRQVAEAVEDLSVEIHTGTDDRILRRMLVTLRLKGEEAGQGADIRFDLQLLDVNEDQDIATPTEARPFDELVGRLGDLGLGGLGAGLGGGGGSSGGSAAPGEATLEEYSECIQDAAGDSEKVRKCADLLATP